MRAFAAAACLLLAMQPATAAGVAIDGMVQHPKTYTLDDLKALPATTVELRTDTMHGTDDHHWTGPLLWSLLTTAGLKDEPGKRTTVRHAILVTGTDGYAATLAIGEIDPALEGKQVILATTSDGPTLSAPKLIVPGDKHGARDIHDVATVTIR